MSPAAPEAPVSSEVEPPPRFLLRPAGVLTQLMCAFALLLGTISFILVQQNKTGGAALVVAWAGTAMAGLVFGGLMARGGLVSVIASALVDAVFGTVLLVLDWDALRSLLRLLPESDVAMIADILVGVAIGMLATSVLCLAAIPQARRYHAALREAEAEVEKSGFFAAQGASGSLPQQLHMQVQVQVALPRSRSTAPAAVPPPPQAPPTIAPGLAFRGGAGSSLAHMPAMTAPLGGAMPIAGAPSPAASGPPAMPAPLAGPPAMSAPIAEDRSQPPAPRASQPPTRISGQPLPLPAPPLTGDGYVPPGARPSRPRDAVGRASSAQMSPAAGGSGAPPDGVVFGDGAHGGAAQAYGAAGPGAVDGRAHGYGAAGPGAVDGAAHGYGATGRGAVDGAAHGYGAVDGAARGYGAADGAAHGYGAVGGAAHDYGAADGAAHGHGAPGGPAQPYAYGAPDGTAPAYGTTPSDAAVHAYGATPADAVYGAASPDGATHGHHAASAGPPPYVEAQLPGAAATAPGWTPSPARTYTTMMIVRPPAVERRSRRRVYIMLGGLAIGLGAGIGILVSSMQSDRAAVASASDASASKVGGTRSNAAGTNAAGASAASTHAAGTNRAGASPAGAPGTTGPGATATGAATPGTTGPGSTATGATATGTTGTTATGPGATATGATSTSAIATGATATGSGATALTNGDPRATPTVPIRTFLDQQRDLIGTADLAKLAKTLAPTAIAIGVDADDVAEGRDAIEAMLTKNLGDPPPDGFKVTPRFLAIGEEGPYAWTAEELELSGPEIATRRFAVTQLAVFANGAWSVVALCWARPVRDATAERLAVLGTLPRPRAIANKADGDPALAAAVAAAFASRKAFADARSERPDAFNFGSGPGERIVGGAKIKALFGRLRAELRQDGGARVIAIGPSAGVAVVNATYTQKGRAATDVTQTFRVLAVLLREGTAWTIVQTQFSNAGPITD